jgi:heptosyltransferase-3
MRVLIVKRDKIGDLLLTTPVIAHLASALPHAEIHLLANDYNAWVVAGHPALARLWIYPRVRHQGRLRPAAAFAHLPLAWHLRRVRFDWAIAMGGEESARAVRRAIATGARRVVAYAADPARYGRELTDPLRLPGGGHETARMMALLAPLGIGSTARTTAPVYRWPDEGQAFARRWLAAHGLARGSYIVLGIGARFACKQPTLDQIVRWSVQFQARWRLSTVFLWTPGAIDARLYPGDDAIAARVVARALPHLHPHRGTLAEALALIAGARTTIIPDSGLMHFAAASEGGVLGLFADPLAAGSAERWGPIGPRARHLEARDAVAALSDDTVMAALEPLIAASPVVP